MGKITGLEAEREIPTKVLMMYQAVEALIKEGADINDIRVSTVTEKAGIGKGTAYDYFDTKEDILACAILFYIRKAMEELEKALQTFDSFAEQVNYLLGEIAGKGCGRQCILHYIHMMTDNSALSRMVQEKVQSKEAEFCLLHGVFAQMLQRGINRGEIRKDLPLDYMVYLLFSKILSYVLWICGDKIRAERGENFRILVYRGILDELCEKNV